MAYMATSTLNSEVKEIVGKEMDRRKKAARATFGVDSDVDSDDFDDSDDSDDLDDSDNKDVVKLDKVSTASGNRNKESVIQARAESQKKEGTKDHAKKKVVRKEVKNKEKELGRKEHKEGLVEQIDHVGEKRDSEVGRKGNGELELEGKGDIIVEAVTGVEKDQKEDSERMNSLESKEVDKKGAKKEGGKDIV